MARPHMAARAQTDDRHSSGDARLNTVRAVLDHNCAGRIDAHGSGGVQEQVRVGLAARDMNGGAEHGAGIGVAQAEA